MAAHWVVAPGPKGRSEFDSRRSPQGEEMSELLDAVEMLERLDKEYEKQQLKFSGEGKYSEALRVKQMRLGIEHSKKVVQRMANGELGLMRTPKGYNPKDVVRAQNVHSVTANTSVSKTENRGSNPRGHAKQQDLTEFIVLDRK